MSQSPRTERSPGARGEGRAHPDRIGPGGRFSRGPAAALGLAAAALGLLAAAGCRGPQRACAPPCPEACQAACAPGHRNCDATTLEALALRLKAGAERPPPGAKTYQILALSGGGKYGAYAAGVLGGWTDAGTRPCFDIVTGVSTGALVATFAFLGPQYDATLRDVSTSLTEADVFRRRRVVALLFANSLSSSAPLRRLIDTHVTDEMIAAVAAEHAAGRRLYIGSTNLDTKRLVVWDMGAIASSDRPDRERLFRDVLQASCAVPGQFPPVQFNVNVNGREYTELHVDGGVTSEIFVRLSLIDAAPGQLPPGPRPLAGSTVHAIVASKLYADPQCTRPRLLGILRGSVASLIYAMTQNDLLRIYTLSLLTGMDFRFTALRADFPDDGNALNFDPAVQRALYAEGYRVGRGGDAGWRTDPPGFRPTEQIVPRTATEFVFPAGTAPVAGVR